MNYNKSRMQVIGSYLGLVVKILDEMGIFTENMISGCSPLAMTGTFDKAYRKYSDMPELKPHELLNIRKNLDKVLSHDQKNFTDNYNIQPFGKESRLQNTSEYLVYMNSCITYPVLEKTDMVYSEYTTAEIINAIKNSEGGFTRRKFPFSGSFNWKYYYDRFIDVVLNEYDPNHIIFIRSNCSRFYMDEHNIKAFDNLPERFVGMLEEMDNYFIEKTHCLVVDEHFNNIPPRCVACLFPYIQMESRSATAIADAIYEIIVNKSVDKYKSHFYGYTSDFSKALHSRLSKDVVSQNEEHLKYIDDNMLTIDKLSKIQSGTCEFFDNIIKLKQFLDIENRYRLAEYAVDVQNKKIAADIELIELYTRYFKLDLNDIVAVYLLCNECENAVEYQKIISNILNNSDCISVNSARKFKEKNIAFLKEYPYISIKEFTEDDGDVYVPLENNCYIVLNSNSETPIRKFEFNVCEEFDYNKVISDGYICSIESADALTYSFDYYIEKARKGDADKPTFLVFKSEHEFFDSLNYVDYPSLLENERFVFIVGESKSITNNDFKPIVDLTEFFDPYLVTVKITSGLGDQIGYYVLGQLIEEYSGRKVIYDDTYCQTFNGLEVNRFSKKTMPIISQKFSKRLFSIVKLNTKFFAQFYRKINPEYIYFVGDYKYRYKTYADSANCFLTSNMKTAITTKLPFSAYHYWISIDKAKSYFNFNLSDYIEFPPFERPEHISLSEKILSCDSVIIHVRRGDYLTVGWGIDNNYYVEKISKIMEMKEYPNKKFFVFSDDIRWCRENPDKLGLDRVGDCEVFYIEGNKFDESFRDIQLMALGKIMIIGNSYFSRIAALYNDKWEMFFADTKERCDLFAKYVRKNKYELDTTTVDSSLPLLPKNDIQDKTMRGGVIIGREYVEWLNFWFDNANEKRTDRILLIGDSVARDYRRPLAQLTKKPVDFFATNTSISNDKFYETLDLFFSYKEYRQTKAHIQIGVHGIDGVEKAIQSNSIEEYEKAYEKLVVYILKYIPDLTVALTTSVVNQEHLSEPNEKINNEIIKRNQVAKKIAEKYKLKVNDLYSFMLNEPHRDWVHFPAEGSEKIARKVAEVMKLI